MIHIVTGMHRSGTSLLAGLLHNNDIPFGNKKTFMPEPDKDNPKGYFEDFELRRINDLLLGSVGYDVKSWSTDIPIVYSASSREYVKIKRAYAERERLYEWGAKDPRFCLTWQAWKFPFSETRFILVYRHPSEVAASLQKRNGLSIDVALSLWRQYNLRALEIEKEYPLAVVSYPHVLSGIIPDKKNLIDVTLKHNNMLSEEVPESCKDVWKKLLDRTTIGGIL